MSAAQNRASTTTPPPTGERLEREREFWDHTIPSLEERITDYHRGPEPNTRLMLEAIRPQPGMRVLDFACGAGVTSCWLAASGAQVTGVDLSPESIAAAKELAEAVGVDVEFIADDVESLDLPQGGFDAIVGRYALHHLDVAHTAPVLAACLKPGGRGAFLETMGYNPVLRFARDHVAGKFGVSRYGTDDEHPLRQPDIQALRKAFVVGLTQAEYRFLLIFDRQALHGRWPAVTRIARRLDQFMAKMPVLRRWSFHQVVVMQKPPIDTVMTPVPGSRRVGFAPTGSHSEARPLDGEALVRQALAAPQVFDRPADETDAHRRH